MLSNTDTDAAGRALRAMLEMGKIEVAELERAFRAEPATT
jgi:hypothetical protein